jgi:hypothetical protein
LLALSHFFWSGAKPSVSPKQVSEFASVSQVDSATAVAVQMTAYSTTLLADGNDNTLLRITVIDREGREITSASNSLQIYVDYDTYSTNIDNDAENFNHDRSTKNANLDDYARITKSGGNKSLVTAVDTSGKKYFKSKLEKGYSPQKGFCGLSHTLDMAKRVKKAGMKLLLNFHYSDYWADPQQQNKPLAWADLDFEILKDTLREYTRNVLLAFQEQGVLPDMVQIGKEVNQGLLWPDGHISNLDNLAELLKAGAKGAASVAPDMPVMMHIALGGQNKEAVFWLNNMIARGVKFDIIGISYYPRWHGSLDDLKFNLTDLAGRYKRLLNVVEYATFKKEVHEIVFSVPNNLGTGTCIWEPLSPRWGGMFSDSGQALDVIRIYDELRDKYLVEE